jgi:hypothetical protein
MLKIPKILAQSYLYTKNHKFLWFFGFFLTGGGVFNFVRLANIESNGTLRNFDYFSAVLYAHPHYYFFFPIIIIFFAAVLLLAALSRAAIINATVSLERKEPITLAMLFKKSQKKALRLAVISLVIDLAVLIILFWLLVPILFLMSKGYFFRGIILAFTALCIFVPLLAISFLENIFAAGFVTVFNMHPKQALKSSFDLFARFWSESIALLIILSIIYILLFFFSASILGFLGLLAYGLLILIKSLSVSLPLFLYSGIISAASVILVLALLFINATLNVFTNIAWTLFFLDAVKSKPLPKEEVAAAAAPVIPLT